MVACPCRTVTFLQEHLLLCALPAATAMVFAAITSSRGIATGNTLAVHGLAVLSAAELEPGLLISCQGM